MRSVLVLALCARGALACPPAAAVDGDAALAREIADALALRGVGAASPRCPAAVAHVERRGERIVVRIASVERDVSTPATAATVIESFARSDLTAPLLRAPAPPQPPAPKPAVQRGVQLFAAAETARGSDATSWFGAELGACITLGRVCAGARMRLAGLADGETFRHAHELLLGVDLPVGGVWSLGVALGMGEIHTRMIGSDDARETAGPRADLHATVSIPIGRRTAFDLAVAAELVGARRVEGGSALSLPDEPRALVRLGAGIRFGGL